MYLEMNYINLKEKSKDTSYLYIDVRSPKEFSEATIPNAINIPILDNDERALVGREYKQESKELAKKTGLEIVSRKLPNLYEEINKLEKKYDYLVFFCSRGGYRSSSLVGLLSSIGVKAIKLIDGYKGYRQHINESLPLIVSDLNFVVLYGNTGTGKTHILHYLKELGLDILDLEGCANHRGSILGSVGLGEQNSQKMFESLVFESLNNRKTNTIFVEGESRRIGKDVIPLYLFQSMKEGKNIKITADLETRVENILKDYVHNTDNELIEALNHLRKYLGNENIDTYIQLIKSHDYERVIQELIINYYDPLYGHNKREYIATFHSKHSKETAKELLKWVRK